MCDVFRVASELTEQLRLSPAGSIRDDDYFTYKKLTDSAVDQIERTIKHARGSEMDFIEYCGECGIRRIDEQLINLNSLVDPVAPRGYAQFDSLTHQPIIDLAQLVVPIMKLSKLFFRKLLKHGINCQRLPSFTQMNSSQLRCLCQPKGDVIARLRLLFEILLDVDATFPAPRPDAIRNITQTVEQIASDLEAASLSVVRYVVPLIDSLVDQNSYQAWFVTWNAFINTAIHNFVQAANHL